MSRLANLTLYFLPASASPDVVVIRRGPSKWWHFLVWNRDTGEVTPGSWFNGMIYPHRCDVSPRGDWMVILAYRGTRQPIAWTALCQPPNAAAVAFWPQQTCRIGGGFFDGRLPVLWLNLPRRCGRCEVRGEHPFEWGFLDKSVGFYGTPQERLVRDGWKPAKTKSKPEEKAVQVFRWRKSSPNRNHVLGMEFEGTLEQIAEDPSCFVAPRVKYFQVKGTGAAEEWKPIGTECSWAEWNSRSQICFSEGGLLLTAEPGDVEGTRHLVMDLNGLRPRDQFNVPTPIPLAGG